MISALEIGFALSLLAGVAAYALLQPQAKPVPVRIRDSRRRRSPQS